MIFKKIKVSFINKKYIRKINTSVLQNLLLDLATDKEYFYIKGKVSVDALTNASNKLNNKIEIDKKELDYKNIEENLKESERLLNDIQSKFEKIRGNNHKMDIEIKEIKIKSDDINIENLNNNNILNQNYIKEQNIIKQDNILNQESIESVQKNASTIRKSILEVEWLQPFLEFMNNHSTLVLTIGSGLVMGGMWYMNNIGIINIGSLLARLGIRIFSGLSGSGSNTGGENIYRGESNITLPGQANGERITNRVATGFFRELGAKVLSLIDIMIERLKENKQKYK